MAPDLRVIHADRGIDLDVVGPRVLAYDLFVDLTVGRDIDHDIAEHFRGTRQPAADLEFADLRLVILFGLGECGQMLRARLETVLRELALGHEHLAAAAEPATAADGIDIHTQRPGGLQDRCPDREPAPSPGRAEYDEGVFLSHAGADHHGGGCRCCSRSRQPPGRDRDTPSSSACNPDRDPSSRRRPAPPA